HFNLISSLKALSPNISLEVTCFLPTGVARGHWDQGQASRRWLQEGGQECECKAILLFQTGS
uniref:Uncharacterized protein n=1 Tax=Prolemur simus TaxID=1328070 RepID=A0A8C9DEW8_PROSS